MTALGSKRTTSVVLTVGVGLAHSAFLWSMANWLWSRDHYQFFPIVLLGAGILAHQRLQNVSDIRPPTLTLRIILYTVFSCSLFTGAVLLQSNWIGTVAFLTAIWTLIWFIGGEEIAARLRGPMCLILLIIPLPLNLDNRLIVELQEVSTQFASSMLDLCGLKHSISGVAIATTQKNFMVEEACSGVHSLFSCLCVMAFICAMQQYGSLRALLILAQTVGWVVAANTLRVFLIVYAYTVLGIALDTGIGHELLGAVTYGVALLLSLSADRLLFFVVPAASLVTFKKTTAYSEGSASSQVMKQVEGRFNRINQFFNKSRFPPSTSLNISLCVLLLFFTPLTILNVNGALSPQGKQQVGLSNPDFQKTIENLLSAPDIFLSEPVGWQLIETKTVERQRGSLIGESTNVLRFSGSGLIVDFSIDRYFQDWNNLSAGYQAEGWKLGETTTQVSRSANYSTTLSLYSHEKGNAVSVYACFDSDLNPLRASLTDRYDFRSLLERLNLGSPKSAIRPPVIQLQAVCLSNHQLLEDEVQCIETFFSRLCNDFLSSVNRGEQ